MGRSKSQRVHEIAAVTGIAKGTVHKIVSALTSIKCLLTGIEKCSPRSTKIKE
jgi:DNA-binding IclR family transcriptional regulator